MCWDGYVSVGFTWAATDALWIGRTERGTEICADKSRSTYSLASVLLFKFNEEIEETVIWRPRTTEIVR